MDEEVEGERQWLSAEEEGEEWMEREREGSKVI